MEPDDLDRRIRSLVARVVDDAPRAPQLPRPEPTRATAVRPRRVVWASLGIAAALALTGVLVWRMGDRDRHLGPTASDATTTTMASRWPAGVAVIVSGEQGVDRVTEANGRRPRWLYRSPEAVRRLASSASSPSSPFQKARTLSRNLSFHSAQPGGKPPTW